MEQFSAIIHLLLECLYANCSKTITRRQQRTYAAYAVS